MLNLGSGIVLCFLTAARLRRSRECRQEKRDHLQFSATVTSNTSWSKQLFVARAITRHEALSIIPSRMRASVPYVINKHFSP